MGKGVVIGLCSVLLVACVVAVTIGVTNKGGDDAKVTTSNKAVNSVCQQTDYKEACIHSLENEEADDPKELVKAEFKAAIENIGEAIKNSAPIKEAAKDERTSKAVELCKHLLDVSIDDLHRSLDKIGKFEVSKIGSYLDDLETWLSGSIDYQETCLDGFENTTGDAGEKMKKLLNVSGELTSNVLAMVSQLNKVLGDLQIPGLSRKLLSSEGEPLWVDAGRRSLLQANPKPNAVVALDGSGNFKSINDAIKTIPLKNKAPFVILVKPGIYKEYVEIPRHMNNVVLIGSGTDKTKITGSKNFADGVGTYQTATVAVNADFFTAKDITFENSAGAVKHQAVALRVSGDMAIFHNCQMDAFQDTLYTHSYRQYYRDCTISGTIDFIFGDAAVVFQNCKMVVRKPGPNQACMVTAQGRKDPRSKGGIILQNCTVTGEPELMSSKPPVQQYLGRPWKEFSRTIIMQSFIDSNIAPEGWAPWNGNFALDTLYYAEFENRGPGSNVGQRVKWNGIKKINGKEAESYAPGVFIQGDTWIKAAGVPYDPGMMRV
ncbi:hypothetical protein LguiA_031224 [Lonicera macranthoides]